MYILLSFCHQQSKNTNILFPRNQSKNSLHVHVFAPQNPAQTFTLLNKSSWKYTEKYRSIEKMYK